MYKKLGLAAIYMGITFVIYRYGDTILSWFQQSDNVGLVIIMAALMALFPVIPYPVVGGVIGAALGPVQGAMVTWTGSATASILMFLFIRYGYQEWGVNVLHRYKRIGKLTELFEKNAFLTILFARLIPFIPSIVINTYAALSRVSFTSYAVASSLGKIPAALLFVTVGDNLMGDPKNILVTISVYGVFLALSLFAYRLWKRKQFQQTNLASEQRK
ncbi:TVP38/TMEM64 family protein [Paenibacillus prosopidis]|uniref:TVP38/TMEM64 family membrane protein n=1 Tax=Paenibacillus prosopidis TaxID=630520 RepID=A0A368W525_9BACL|nr:TVP38/TMEM64 family protein [Paenibacillus prosopidis]RCW47966.1 putative membrane protein YdjX (TVP38/TMEM64 family) [Paenibacillus prosopidis]